MNGTPVANYTVTVGIINEAALSLMLVGPAVWYAGQMEPRVGSFSQYAYFLLCPTLLYRDNYPRYTCNYYRTWGAGGVREVSRSSPFILHQH